MSLLVAAPCQEPRGLAGDVAAVVVVFQYHVEGPVAGEPLDDPDVLAGVEGGCDRRVPQPVGPDGPADPGALAHAPDGSPDRLAREADARVGPAAVEPVEERALVITPRLDPGGQGRGRRRRQGEPLPLAVPL